MGETLSSRTVEITPDTLNRTGLIPASQFLFNNRDGDCVLTVEMNTHIDLSVWEQAVKEADYYCCDYIIGTVSLFN